MSEADAALLQQFSQGDAEAMGRLVSRHGSSVYAFVRRFLGETQASDDVYQEVWLRVIRNATRFEGRSRFTTWLFQVTRNVCMDHLREKRRRRTPVSLEQESPASPEPAGEASLRDRLPDGRPSTPDEAASREERSRVERAVTSLSDEQREVFLLREQTELTFEEIAKLLDLSPNTVKSRMRYALENLRRALEPSSKPSEGAIAHGM
jgi:RNA polymerase sigma-70 factor (ECF subfamily)